MISMVEGKIWEKGENYLIISIHGIGFKIFVSEQVIANYSMSDSIKLFTHLIVREDNLSLYGFENHREERLFQQLIKVSGIGPRTALAILSHLSQEIIFQAVRDEKPQIFSQVPGIGLKTAQKLVLFLHDIIKDENIMENISLKISDLQTDLLEALTGLGYSVIEAQTAIQSLPKDTPEDLETRLRLALQYFS